MKKKAKSIILLCLMAFIGSSCTPFTDNAYYISSPSGNIKVNVKTLKGQLTYSVEGENKIIIADSKMGFMLKNLPDLGNKVKITGAKSSTFNETWEQPWGEKRLIENRYDELVVNVEETGRDKRKFDIIFKVYNDGLGFRYEIPVQPNLDSVIIMKEVTEFKLPTIDNAWWIPAYTEPYYESITRFTPVNKMDTVCTPLTIETKGGKYLTIHQANLTDYAAMNLYCADTSTLTCDLTPWNTGEKVFTKAPFVSPWRMVIIADRPGDLITSYLELNLNDPCKIGDISWIKPGRYIGIWWGMHMEKYSWNMGPKHGATTENTMRYIDFAAKHDFSGVLVEGWNYGWENDWTKEGDKFSFTKSYPDFDIEKITKYGDSKGVKLIGHHETGGATINYERQMEEGFKLYHNLGMNCVKTGYVGLRLDGKERHSSQYGVRHFRNVVETAAKYHIMIDNHEPVVPTGIRRTFPNLMTGEGMRGQEYNAWSRDGGNKPDHLTIIPFTRGLAGPMDYTPGIFKFENQVNPQTHVQTTISQQLALYVILYSPLQMAADLPENYEGNPAFKFIESVPVNWDVTKVLDAKIGDYIITVRKDRASEEWFLGAITDENARGISCDLSFLDKDVNYIAEVYRDGENADYQNNPTSIIIEKKEVKSSDILWYNLGRAGGVAIRFIPKGR